MNRSIRYKLLAYILAGITVFTLLLFGANKFFAEKYYMEHNKRILINTTKEVTKLISGKNEPAEFLQEDIVYSLSRLEKSIGGSITIGKQAGTLYYPYYYDIKGKLPKGIILNPFMEIDKNMGVMNKRGQMFAKSKGDVLRSIEVIDANSFFLINKDPGLKIDTLRYQTQLPNEVTILVWVPLAEISESADVSNRFTAIVALITMCIMGLWALYISDRFSKPLIQMNSTAKRMAELDFSQNLDIASQDEIGQLSQSINYLSNKLNLTIRELNEKNRQLEKDIDKGRRIDASRREFVSNVSHELKTPIFLIQGYAEGLKNNIAEDEEKRSFYCDVIMEEAEKMDVIVKDLLNLAQIESEKMELTRSDFDAELLIRGVVAKLEPIFKEKEIAVETMLKVSELANGDHVRIEQVLVNYLNNALNHVDKKKQIKITAQQNEDKIRVSVYNSGQQIPEELHERIWNSFYKVDKARTRGYGGTGLGLAIVKAIQQAHNSAYGVSNTEEGVVFWFDVALAK